MKQKTQTNIHEQKLHNLCVSVYGTAVKILASKFLAIVEILTI